MKKKQIQLIVLLISFNTVLFPLLAFAQNDGKPAKTSIDGYIFKPVKVDATDERVKQLKVPEGFHISKFAEGLKKPRMI